MQDLATRCDERKTASADGGITKRFTTYVAAAANVAMVSGGRGVVIVTEPSVFLTRQKFGDREEATLLIHGAF